MPYKVDTAHVCLKDSSAEGTCRLVEKLFIMQRFHGTNYFAE